jgi:WD40 repeat protein/tetratricopeptide (TPR) repeat protein
MHPESWRTVRVFISSTFRDMHAERDLLVRLVFPELRQRCAQRRLHVVEIDLRWGVTEEEAQKGHVLDLCLNEIERCRPFFVGLLGDRYGWAPMSYEPELEACHTWLKDAERGLSLTALEIHAALLGDEKTAARALFYFRGVDGCPEGAEAEEKLTRLKGFIRERSQVREYARADEAFGRRVLEDLWSAIEEEYPAHEPPPSTREIEQQRHESFAAARARRFAGRAEELRAIDEYVRGSESLPLVVTGGLGSGKSALLARCAAEITGRYKDMTVLPHFAGSGPGSTDVRRIVLRLIREISNAFLMLDEIPEAAGYEELVTCLKDMLGRVHERGKLTLILDGLEQIATPGMPLSFLPSPLPPAVRVIAASQPFRGLDLLRRAPTPPVELGLSPFNQQQRRELVRSILSDHRKRLEERPAHDQMAALLAKAGADRALYLAVACEELRVFGEFERVDERIALLPDSLYDLFGQVLDRLEGDHGADLVTRALGFLACSCDGLLESELIDLLNRDAAAPIAPAAWARLRHSLDLYLSVSGEGLLSFFHDRLRDAVERRYLDSAEQTFRDRLAFYFRSRVEAEGYPRGLVELRHQLRKAGRWTELASLLCDLRFLEASCAAGLAFDLAADYSACPPEGGVREFERWFVPAASLFAAAPELVFQQALNAPEGSAPARAAAAMAYPHPAALWRHINKVEGFDASVRVLRTGSENFGVAWSPNGSRIACASEAGLHIWDVQRGIPVLKLVEGSAAHSPAFSLDGALVASGRASGTVVIQDAETGAVVRELEGHAAAVNCCAWSRDGSRLISGSQDGLVKVRDTASGREIAEWMVPGTFVTCAAWSTDGRRIALGCRHGELEVRDLISGTLLVRKQGHRRWLTGIVWQGDRIISASLDGQIRFWSAAGEQTACIGEHDARVRACAFAFGDRLLISVADDGAVKVASVTAERVVAVFPPGDRVSRSFPACGRMLRAEFRSESLVIVDEASGEVAGYLETERATEIPPEALDGHYDGEPSCGAVSQDGTLLAIGFKEGGLTVFGLGSARNWAISALRGHLSATGCGVSPDGKLLATWGEFTTQIWDLETLALRSIYDGHANVIYGGAWSPAGTWLATASADRTVRIWDTSTTSIAERWSPVGSCLWSQDGTRLIAIHDFTPAYLDPANLAVDRRVQRRMAFTAILGQSMNGQHLLLQELLPGAEFRRALSIVDVNTGVEERRIEHESDSAESAAWSPDGRLLAVGWSSGRVELRDAASGELLDTLCRHRGAVRQCVFSDCGQHVLSCGRGDERLALSSVGIGCAIEWLWNREKVEACAFAPGGEWFASVCADGMLHAWKRGERSPQWKVKAHTDAALACVWTASGVVVTGGADGMVAASHNGALLAKFPTVAPVLHLSAHPADEVVAAYGIVKGPRVLSLETKERRRAPRRRPPPAESRHWIPFDRKSRRRMAETLSESVQSFWTPTSNDPLRSEDRESVLIVGRKLKRIALPVPPRSPEPQDKLCEQADRLLAAGRIAEAMDRYDRATEIDKRDDLKRFHGRAVLSQAEHYLAIGDHQSAKRHISTFLVCRRRNDPGVLLDGRFLRARLMMGQVAIAEGRGEAAAGLCDEVAELAAVFGFEDLRRRAREIARWASNAPAKADTAAESRIPVLSTTLEVKDLNVLLRKPRFARTRTVCPFCGQEQDGVVVHTDSGTGICEGCIEAALGALLVNGREYEAAGERTYDRGCSMCERTRVYALFGGAHDVAICGDCLERCSGVFGSMLSPALPTKSEIDPQVAGDPIERVEGEAIRLYNEANYKSASWLWRQLAGRLALECGERNAKTIAAIGMLALALTKRAKYDAAKTMYRRAIDLAAAVLGPGADPTIAYAMNYGVLLCALGSYDESEPLLRRALERWPEQARELTNLAILLRGKGNDADAELLLRQALAKTREGDDRAALGDAALRLGELLHARGEFGEAEPLLRAAVEARERAAGPEHPDTAEALTSLAAVLRDTGRFEEAEQTARRAAIIHHRTLGPQHPETAVSLSRLASIAVRMGGAWEPQYLFDRAWRVLRHEFGESHPATATCARERQWWRDL